MMDFNVPSFIRVTASSVLRMPPASAFGAFAVSALLAGCLLPGGTCEPKSWDVTWTQANAYESITGISIDAAREFHRLPDAHHPYVAAEPFNDSPPFDQRPESTTYVLLELIWADGDWDSRIAPSLTSIHLLPGIGEDWSSPRLAGRFPADATKDEVQAVFLDIASQVAGEPVSALHEAAESFWATRSTIREYFSAPGSPPRMAHFETDFNRTAGIQDIWTFLLGSNTGPRINELGLYFVAGGQWAFYFQIQAREFYLDDVDVQRVAVDALDTVFASVQATNSVRARDVAQSFLTSHGVSSDTSVARVMARC